MKNHLINAIRKVGNIRKSKLTIYDLIEIGDNDYWLTSLELQVILEQKIVGLNADFPIKTRSKVLKSEVCTALGYPIPKSFKKTKPRFLGQKFDTYIQKANNLQVYNEELDLSRRFVLIRVDEELNVSKVKVVSGSDLAPLDTTGKLTKKYQARLKDITETFEIVSESDTEYLLSLCGNIDNVHRKSNPNDDPIKGHIIPIKMIYEALKIIVGEEFPDPGKDQERNRGAALHRLVCKALGFSNYHDDGTYPDIKSQLLEIKLQTSPTIDLGLVSPDSEIPLDMDKINNVGIRHCDVRYAIFYGKIHNGTVKITNLIVTSGKDFLGRMPKFKGMGLNKKLQIPLPKNYFDS